MQLSAGSRGFFDDSGTKRQRSPARFAAASAPWLDDFLGELTVWTGDEKVDAYCDELDCLAYAVLSIAPNTNAAAFDPELVQFAGGGCPSATGWRTDPMGGSQDYLGRAGYASTRMCPEPQAGSSSVSSSGFRLGGVMAFSCSCTSGVPAGL
jgi:hypothetical protein